MYYPLTYGYTRYYSGYYAPYYGSYYGPYYGSSLYAGIYDPYPYSYSGSYRYGYEQRSPYYSEPRYTPGDGWKLLEQGRTEDAVSAFSHEAADNPDAAVPQVGYALAKAASGDYNNAMWAMRRAFESDPEGVRYLNMTPGLRSLIQDLIGDFEHLQHKYTDAAFMTAALAYLIGDFEAAHAALERARSYGDEWQSTLNLQSLLVKQGLAKSSPP